VIAAEIVPGLLRWVAPHPDWGPGEDWDETVGSVFYDLDDRVALFDPLLPRERREEFLGRLDGLIGGRPVSILTTIRWHSRDRRVLAERYAAQTPFPWNQVPRGVQPRPLRGAGETLFWLPRAEALVAGDRLLGVDGGLQLSPETWLESEGVAVDRRGLARLMAPLLELPIERVLVSHGEPVLHDGRAELARALAEAERG
jgi:hypothetical protein